MNFDLPPVMQATPGITKPRFTADPLGTEEELSPGPNDWNPYEDAMDRREIEELGFDADTVMATPKRRAEEPLANLL